MGGGAVGGGPGGPLELVSLRPGVLCPPKVELDLNRSPPRRSPELEDNPESDQLLCSDADHLCLGNLGLDERRDAAPAGEDERKGPIPDEPREFPRVLGEPNKDAGLLSSSG